MTIQYKFNEEKLLSELKEYIDKTYESHYTGNGSKKIQSIEKIIDNGWGVPFCLGSQQKYADRFGYKSGYNRMDLVKNLHYALLALHAFDEDEKRLIQLGETFTTI